MGLWLRLTRASLLDPMQADTFNAVGGHYNLSCQDVLLSWYMTVMPCRVSGLRTGVCDLGRAECSHRRCVIPVIGEILIFSELTWVLNAGYGFPWFTTWCGGFKAVGSALGPINRGLPLIWSFHRHFGESLP
jgi:hypothetical protein